MRTDGQSYPGSEWQPALSRVPALQKSRLATSPNAAQIEWWRAFPTPSYHTRTASFNHVHGEGEYTREKQEGDFTAIIGTEAVLRRYFQPGTWETGSVTLSYDPEDFPLSEHDWIYPLGQGVGPDGRVGGRTFTQKQSLVRGEKKTPGAGTVSTAGAAVVGAGTSFSTFFHAGDIIEIAGKMFGIVSVADDTHLTLFSAPVTDVAAISYVKRSERLLYPPGVVLVDIRDSAGRVYVAGTDINLALDEETLQWTSFVNSPAPDAAFGLLYTYRARYVITGLGLQRQVINGQPLLSMAVAKLWKPENLQR